MSDCTCDVKPPRVYDAYGHTMGRYSIYMTVIEDYTRFDPACAYHGANGSMVANFKTRP